MVNFYLFMTVCVLVLVLMLHQKPSLLEYLFSAPMSVHNDKLLLLSSDNFCKQFGPRSGSIKRSCQNAACAVLDGSRGAGEWVRIPPWKSKNYRNFYMAFRLWVDDSPLIVLFWYLDNSSPHQTKKKNNKKKNFKVWPPLTKLSGSVHWQVLLSPRFF